MGEYEIIIDEATYERLSKIAAAEDNPLSIAAAANIDPQDFRRFLKETGNEKNKRALGLLKVVESVWALNKARPVPAVSARKRDTELSARVSRTIMDLIRREALPVGTMLPSERQMANSLAVARNVVRGSYEYLAEEGIISIRAGKDRTVRKVKSARKKLAKVGRKKIGVKKTLRKTKLKASKKRARAAGPKMKRKAKR